MSEPEYMTGRELSEAYWKLGSRDGTSVDQDWKDFANIIKAPRPPKPKTLEETYIAWRTAGSIANESSLETLRVLLNEARQKLDGGL